MNSWYHSKIIWFNVLLTVIEVSAYLQTTELFDKSVVPYLVMIQALGNIISRIWFTNKSFGTTKPLSLNDYVATEEKLTMDENNDIASFEASLNPEVLEKNPNDDVVSQPGLTIVKKSPDEFSPGQSATTVVEIKEGGERVSGASVMADYYNPDNGVFLGNQTLHEIGQIGVYYHNFTVPADASAGSYKIIVQAVKERERINFEDNFNIADGPASRWRAVSGDWMVKSNIYKQFREGFFNSVILQNHAAMKWLNYAYEAETRFDGDKIGKVGILGRWSGPVDFYSLCLDSATNGGVLILRRGNSVLKSVNYHFTYPSDFVKLKIGFSGNNIKCYMNNVLKIDFNDTAPAQNGSVGLFTQDVAASFKNVKAVYAGERISSSLITEFKITSPSSAINWGWDTPLS